MILPQSKKKFTEKKLLDLLIFELDALIQSDKVFFTQAMLLWIHHKRMAEEQREVFKHAVLIEESHHILSDERRSLVGGQSVMEIIFREIREFGESLILLDQPPSKISLSALGNTYCTICMNLKHKTDINAIGQCFLLDKEREILGTLDVGEAVVKLQGKIARPFQIKIPEFIIEKGKVTDEDIKELMKDIAHVEPEEDFRLPDINTKIKLSVKETSNNDTLFLFLQDIQKHPDSGIAARYKRLGISVRQGQKIKNKALEKGLIEEQLETTGSGRLKVIQLTEICFSFNIKEG